MKAEELIKNNALQNIEVAGKQKHTKSEFFTLKQLFGIVDGRLSTSISDIQSVFGVYCGRSVFMHELPELIDEVESAKPDWYMQARLLVEYAKWINNTDSFMRLMDILDKDFSNVYIMVEAKL